MPIDPDTAPQGAQRSARLFHHAALLEGSTLVLLVVIAVPLKYLLGEPGFVKALGPIHGMAFLVYIWVLMQSSSACAWPRKRLLLLLLAAFIPFGTVIALTRMQLAGNGGRHQDRA